MSFFDDLRSQLKVYRASHNLSQAAIAQSLGVEQASVSAFETGARNLGSEKIEKLMEIMGLRAPESGLTDPTQPPSLLHEHAPPYGRPSREVPIPSPQQLEFVLDAARRLGDTKTTKALQEMQMQILGIIEQLEPVGHAFTKHVKALEQLKRESQRRPKVAIDY